MASIDSLFTKWQLEAKDRPVTFQLDCNRLIAVFTNEDGSTERVELGELDKNDTSYQDCGCYLCTSIATLKCRMAEALRQLDVNLRHMHNQIEERGL